MAQVAWPTAAACLVIAATICFAVFAVVRWPGGPQTQYLWFYILAPLALLIAGAAALYPADRTGEARDAVQRAAETRRRKAVRAVLVGAAALCCGGGALAWVHVDRTGEVGAVMTIGGPQPVGDAGGTITMEMKRPAPGDVREKLRLSLSIVDDRPGLPTCVDRTTATINVITPGVTPNTRRVPARSTVDFDLGRHGGAVHFEITVRSDSGCSMRLGPTRGTLYSG
ncbi:hypothetical protein [Streptomyces yaizuensis]|uniref:Tat pathway signal sequence domain protein n=1 Tax=Streptomyces yaizuensis TaxID=2989713 RepID=A0ABQ5NXL3_9ACTN|nr:hypothetical protein [Streptomyces sp. YSPA8]GLF95098.1 hypothetical protein SYYSPA8_12395 [Streptomyces sp. YSPA8]